MNSLLDDLRPYPFTRLEQLMRDVEPGLPPILLNVGEPKHPMPEAVSEIIRENMGLFGKYPPTKGIPELRQAVSRWVVDRYGYRVDPELEVLPVLGSREAIFSFVQAAIDAKGADGDGEPLVVCPNPYYQIYQGAAIMAGARPVYAPCLEPDFEPDWDRIPEEWWKRVRLVFVCTPGNPTGKVMGPESWRRLFELQDRHEFIIASDECYSEIHFPGEPSYGLFDALGAEGRSLRNAVVFNSLSKRSNAPGLRSGFVVSSEEIVRAFLSYRTYHGSAMSLPIQKASAFLWSEETHVEENRRLYKTKFDESMAIMKGHYEIELPDASFYYWLKVPGGDDELFAKRLWEKRGVKVVPGSYLGVEVDGVNPGRGRVRIAVVAEPGECREAFGRMVDFVQEDM